MNSFWAALRFLTVFPIPASWGQGESALAKGVRWFPVIGLLLGGVAAIGVGLLQSWVPAPLLCALIVVGLIGFSGALHLDGLSDTADGFLSARPKEKILEIMKDSHIGAMGVTAIAGVLLLKYSALLSVPTLALSKTVLLMPLAGRCAMVLNMALLPYIRPQGLGTVFAQTRHGVAALGGAILLLLTSWFLLGVTGVIAAAASLGTALFLAAYSRHKIGGATGDTYGAVCELTELIPALILAVWPGMR
jgi:adenosylcobinamide-GDP ribazoletransferase